MHSAMVIHVCLYKPNVVIALTAKTSGSRQKPTGIASATEIYSNNAYESLSEYGDEEMDI